jgi:mannose-6-phosphate isomerase-like protein (cupin superfamily)
MPGDLLFVPIGWWHQVRSESFSTMLTYTHFHWPNAGHEHYPAG